MSSSKTCRANVGTRKNPELCGKPRAKGMHAACAEHKTVMIAVPKHPGIYYRGGSYTAVTLHHGKQHKTYHPSLELAREAKSDRTGSVRQAPRARQPFDTYALEWVDNYQGRGQGGFDENTRADYRRALEQWAVPHFRSKPLRDIDRDDIEALIAKMQNAGLSPASVRVYLAPVRRIFSLLVAKGQLPTNPAAMPDINTKAELRNPRKRVKQLSRAELDALIAAISNERDRLFAELLAGTGMRVSEACGLDCADLGQDGVTITISRQWYRGRLKNHTKSQNGQRTIKLPPSSAPSYGPRTLTPTARCSRRGPACGSERATSAGHLSVPREPRASRT